MYKMIIADDEEIIVKGLCKLLDWKSMGIEITALCHSYDEIVAQLNKAPCDILITDVSMPGKNGIEALYYIREKKLPTQVIFISGFSEFSYARDALRGGATDYLTKPVSREGIEEAVNKAIKALNAASEGNDGQRLLYYGVVNDDIQTEKLQRTADKKEFYTALNIYIDYSGKTRQQNELIRFSLSAKIKELLGEGSIVFERGKTVCALANHQSSGRGQILRAAENMGNMIFEETGQSAVVIAGKTVNKMSDIPKSYESAEALGALSFYAKNSFVIDCENAPEINASGDIEYLAKIEKELKEKLYEETSEGFSEAVEAALKKIGRISYGSPNVTRTYLLSMLNKLRQDACEISEDEHFLKKVREEFSGAAEKIGGAQRFTKASDEVCRAANALKALLTESRSAGSDAVVRSKKFIREHYNENITLESVAGHVFMNPYYFSSFFKKHTNKNFKEYLNEIRLENARQMLLTTNLRPSEISEKTGFKNMRSMNKLFKEKYGKIPSEYRKKNK